MGKSSPSASITPNWPAPPGGRGFRTSSRWWKLDYSGIRMLGNLTGVEPGNVEVGLKTGLCFETIGNGMSLPQFYAVPDPA